MERAFTSRGAASQSQARMQRAFRKTTMCDFFMNGRCRKGEACNYAHRIEELRERPDLTKTTICKQWLEGRCGRRARDCKFAHGDAELRVVNIKPTPDDVEASTPSLSPAAGHAFLRSSSALSDDDPFLRTPSTMSGASTMSGTGSQSASSLSSEPEHEFDPRLNDALPHSDLVLERVSDLARATPLGESWLGEVVDAGKLMPLPLLIPQVANLLNQMMRDTNPRDTVRLECIRQQQRLLQGLLEMVAPDHYED